MTENQTPAAKAPTAAQIRTNHERARKAAEKLTGSGREVRATALCPRLDAPAVIVLERRPYNSRNDDDFEEVVRITTTVDQKIGVPVNYSNQYSDSNRGTMCYAIERAEKARQNRMAGLRTFEKEVRNLREQLAHAEARVAARKEELGISDNPYEQIAEELSNKFTGTVYRAHVELAADRGSGDTLWRVEYTDIASGERVPEYDGLILRSANGVTSVSSSAPKE